VDEIAARFAAAYERTYGHSFDLAVTIVSVRAIERTLLPRPSVAPAAAPASGGVTAELARAYSFVAGQWLDFSVIDRADMAPGARFAGPAIVLEPTTTTYVDIGFQGSVHERGALILTDSKRTEV
jgi:N-methylhydantoinase A